MLPSYTRVLTATTDRIKFVDAGALPVHLSTDVGEMVPKCWLGADTVICLDRRTAGELAKVLQHFAEHGRFPPDESYPKNVINQGRLQG